MFQNMPRPLQFFIAMVGFSLIGLTLGPSQLLHLPDNYYFIASGISLQGIFEFFIFVPVLPEMLDRMNVELQLKNGRDDYFISIVNDKCNDAYQLYMAVAMFTSPLIGEIIT